MFFILGIDQKQKELTAQGPVICSDCGRYARYQVYMTYMCLSLFFIPVLKWGRKYYVETSCCHSLYELDAEVGNALRRGEDTEIRQEHLTRLRSGKASYGSTYTNPARSRRCPGCGYETEEDFAFCPKCGGRLE